jgi:hypothetical protein
LVLTDAAVQSSDSAVFRAGETVLQLASGDDELVVRRVASTMMVVLPETAEDDALSLRFVFSPGDDDSPLGAHTLLIRGTEPSFAVAKSPATSSDTSVHITDVDSDMDEDDTNHGESTAEGGDPDPSPADGGDPDPSPADGGDPDPSPADGSDPDPSPAGDPDPTMARCKDCTSDGGTPAPKIAVRSNETAAATMGSGRAAFVVKFAGLVETIVDVEPGTEEARVELHIPAKVVVDAAQSAQTGTAAALNNVGSSVVIEKQKKH